MKDTDDFLSAPNAGRIKTLFLRPGAQIKRLVTSLTFVLIWNGALVQRAQSHLQECDVT